VVRVRIAAVCLAALVAAPVAAAQTARTPPGPTALKGFLLRATEPSRTTFPRTPSFSWNPVRGAIRYEFQLATTPRFNEGSLVWSNVDPRTELAPDASQQTGTPAPSGPAPAPSSPAATAEALRNLRSPALALDVALPWITGEPFALHARVRAVLRNGATRWSRSYGFNVRWGEVPRPLPSVPGLLRWTTVDGATGYEVWILGAARTFTTTANVADQRDLFTFKDASPSLWSTVRWRVRPLRALYGEPLNGLPVAKVGDVGVGAWSAVYTSYNPPFDVGPIALRTVISDVQSTPATPRAHRLTPAYAWGGLGLPFPAAHRLWRVYVSTDRDCVNVVFRGAVVGSPAYAPRPTGPLKLPHTAAELQKASAEQIEHGAEGEALMLDGTPAETHEGEGGTAAKVDLWDNSFASGGYYWTVVPVVIEPVPNNDSFRYRDLELPQDACQSGRVMRFAKASSPVLTASGAPFASGLSPQGRLVSSAGPRQAFYGSPLVAWAPALGAHEYEVQWSRALYPWRRVGSTVTPATSTILPLTPGTWYYRVRGLNHGLPRRPEMGWSVPMRIQVTRPVFAVVR
jgi:hypothetical protein